MGLSSKLFYKRRVDPAQINLNIAYYEWTITLGSIRIF